MLHRPVGVLLLGSLLSTGCAEDEVVNPLGEGGQSAGGEGGTAAGGGGTGGAGGTPDRGDPADFPTDCITSCNDACQAMVECGSESSPVHPMGLDDCLARCGLAVNGPIWDDVSGVFRCCASQEECTDVAHCGGWLAHPSTVEPCGSLCACFFSSTVESLTSGHTAPQGYKFAPDAVYVEPSGTPVDLERVPGVREITPGRLLLVRLDDTERAETLALLGAAGRVLPTLTDGAGRLAAVTGKLIVRAPSEAGRRNASRALVPFGMAPRGEDSGTRFSFAKDLVLYETVDAWRALDAALHLESLGIHAELDLLRTYDRTFSPNDPQYEDQWHLDNNGQGDSTPSVDARVDEAWDVTTGDSAVVIAIHDDGVDLNHPDFSGKLLPEQNYPSDWEAQMASGLFGSHGTSVAGVAAARGNNLFSGSGACSGCSVLPRLLGETVGPSFQVTDVEVAEGFTELVDAGAWIISNSWGISTGDPVYVENQLPLPPLAAVVKGAFDYAETSGRMGLGTVIVFAAGNSNDKLEALGSYETNLAVGAVNDLGLKSYYSSFGPLLDVAAPSNGGLTGITTTAINGTTTDSFGGTSSACPLVSGVLGLIFSANPGLTAAEARTILTSTATKIDPVFGNYDVDGVSPYYGHGMINAARAVRLAAGLCADAASCVAPSDQCGASCGTKTMCDTCRTTADCVPGSVCQALPSLGILTCVAPSAGTCPADTVEMAGHCIPTTIACDLCAPAEICNGRDDDCDGAADENDVCEGPARCFFDEPGCGPDQVCAGSTCVKACDNNDECGEGEACRPLKDAYGNKPIGKFGCVTNQASGCQLGCEVIASTLNDEDLATFVTCIDEAGFNCGAMFPCASILPIQM